MKFPNQKPNSDITNENNPKSKQHNNKLVEEYFVGIIKTSPVVWFTSNTFQFPDSLASIVPSIDAPDGKPTLANFEPSIVAPSGNFILAVVNVPGL